MANIPMLGSGEMRESISFQYKKAAPSDLNDAGFVWTVRMSGVRARVEPLMRGSEQLIAHGITPVSTFQITIHNCAAAQAIIASDMIVNDRTKVQYNIRLVTNPDERGRFLVLLAETGVAQ